MPIILQQHKYQNPKGQSEGQFFETQKRNPCVGNNKVTNDPDILKGASDILQ